MIFSRLEKAYFTFLAVAAAIVTISLAIGRYFGSAWGSALFTVLLLIAAFLRGRHLLDYYFKKPYFIRSIRTCGTLDIVTSDGSRAHYREEAHLNVLKEGVSSFPYTKVAATGGAENFATNMGRIPGPSREADRYIIDIVFENPLSVGTLPRPLILTYDYIDSFISDQEYFFSHIKRPTDFMDIRIIFPDGADEPKDVYVEVEEHNLRRILERPIYPSENQEGRWEIYWSIDNPSIGARYIVRWRWRPIPLVSR